METNQEVKIKVGDVFDMSWGYDQTNTQFFQVTRLTPKGVYVREIGYKAVEQTQGFMCQYVNPTPDTFLKHSQWTGEGNPELLRKIGYTSGKPYFSLGRSYCAFLWDGKACYQSWYA